MTPETQMPSGLVAMIVTGGSIKAQTASCLAEMRSYNDRNGIHDVEYRIIPATLVENGRDEACAHALRSGYAWMLQIDADATFPPDSIATALSHWWPSPFDVVGAYAQIKGAGIPTIDTGSGTWEEHYPGEGMLPVVRTGGHFLFVKCDALRLFGPPWFRSRIAPSPLRAIAEFDTFARTQCFNGANPLADTEAWEKLVAKAKTQPTGTSGPVGEDSSFCDALVAAGGHIAVDTDFVTGHVTEEVILPDRFIRHVRDIQRHQRMALGIL